MRHNSDPCPLQPDIPHLKAIPDKAIVLSVGQQADTGEGYFVIPGRSSEAGTGNCTVSQRRVKSCWGRLVSRQPGKRRAASLAGHQAQKGDEDQQVKREA
jgi:hypothetical protein